MIVSKHKTLAVLLTAFVLTAAGGATALAATTSGAASNAATATTTTHSTESTHCDLTKANQLTWHPLHLINGWQALSARYYGAPSYAIQDGILYLSGILRAPHPTVLPEFAQLPTGARPKHFLWLIYYNFGGGGTNLVGNMEIEPDGGMFAYANGGPILDPSLQAISFPVNS